MAVWQGYGIRCRRFRIRGREGAGLILRLITHLMLHGQGGRQNLRHECPSAPAEDFAAKVPTAGSSVEYVVAFGAPPRPRPLLPARAPCMAHVSCWLRARAELSSPASDTVYAARGRLSVYMLRCGLNIRSVPAD